MIVPTAYSSRWNEQKDRDEPGMTNEERQLNLPSSPPSSQGEPNEARVPRGLPVEDPRTPLQLSSPASSQDGDLYHKGVPVTSKKGSLQQRLAHDGLTSSVVKGEAASGLIELMRRGGES